MRLAEMTGASVLTSVRERAAFPTDHALHAAPPFFWMSKRSKDVVAEADLILSLDWPDLNGTLQQCTRDTVGFAAKIVHVPLDSTLHNGWSMDYFGLVPADLAILTGADTFTRQVLPAIEQRLEGKKKWDGDNRNTALKPEYSKNSATEIAPRDVEVALSKARGNKKLTLATFRCLESAPPDRCVDICKRVLTLADLEGSRGYFCSFTDSPHAPLRSPSPQKSERAIGHAALPGPLSTLAQHRPALRKINSRSRQIQGASLSQRAERSVHAIRRSHLQIIVLASIKTGKCFVSRKKNCI